MHEYGDDFYAFLSSFAVRSAEHVVPLVLQATGARSVADFGCGQGAWLSVYRKAGLAVQGVDGPYVKQDRLLIPPSCFLPADLAAGVSLGRFDLAQSLETAEHLPPAKAAGLVAMLTAHSDFVLFSAAVPGQGGEHHINEQPLGYWRALFARHGYVPCDISRPILRDNPDVQRWYRYNTLLYVKQARLAGMPGFVRDAAIPAQAPIANFWPARFVVQHGIISLLPRAAVDFLARLAAMRFPTPG